MSTLRESEPIPIDNQAPTELIADDSIQTHVLWCDQMVRWCVQFGHFKQIKIFKIAIWPKYVLGTLKISSKTK